MSKMIKDFESYLKKVKLSQKVIIYMIPWLLVVGAVSMFITPAQDEKLDELSYKQENLKKSIKKMMPKTLKKKIQSGKKELLNLKDKVAKKSDDLNYLFAKFDNLELSEFNEKRWTDTLDNILNKSLVLNLEIDHIKNSDAKTKKPNQSIIPKKYIEIKGKGSYSDIIKYLDFIENRDFIVDVKEIKIAKPSDNEKRKVEFAINFTIYGVEI